MCCVVLAHFVESSSGMGRGGIGACLFGFCCHPSLEQLFSFLGVELIRIMFSENCAKGKSLVLSHSLNFITMAIIHTLPPLPFTILTLKNHRGPH